MRQIRRHCPPPSPSIPFGGPSRLNRRPGRTARPALERRPGWHGGRVIPKHEDMGDHYAVRMMRRLPISIFPDDGPEFSVHRTRTMGRVIDA